MLDSIESVFVQVICWLRLLPFYHYIVIPIWNRQIYIFSWRSIDMFWCYVYLNAHIYVQIEINDLVLRFFSLFHFFCDFFFFFLLKPFTAKSFECCWSRTVLNWMAFGLAIILIWKMLFNSFYFIIMRFIVAGSQCNL